MVGADVLCLAAIAAFGFQQWLVGAVFTLDWVVARKGNIKW